MFVSSADSLLKATGIRQIFSFYDREEVGEVGSNCPISPDAAHVKKVSVLTKWICLAANTGIWEHLGFRSLKINISRLSPHIRKPLNTKYPNLISLKYLEICVWSSEPTSLQHKFHSKCWQVPATNRNPIFP